MPGEKSALERAKSKFTLVEPIAASERLWDAYTAERRAVRKEFSTVLLENEEEGDEVDYDVTQKPRLFTFFLG